MMSLSSQEKASAYPSATKRLWAASNSPFWWINLSLTSVTGGVTQSNIKQISGHSISLWPLFVLLYFSCHLSAPPFQNRTIPCFAPSHLPPLLKGGGLTARHKPWYYCFLLAICQPFLCCKLFAVKTEGLHNNPSPRITLSKTVLSLCPAPHSRLPWVKWAGLRQSYFYHKLSCSAIQVYLIFSQPYLSQGWRIVTPSAPPFPKPHYSFALHHILGSLE